MLVVRKQRGKQNRLRNTIYSGESKYMGRDIANRGVVGNWDTATAARYLNCSEGTLRQWVSKRRIPFVRVGRLVRFRREDLDRWMDERLVLPTKQVTGSDAGMRY